MAPLIKVKNIECIVVSENTSNKAYPQFTDKMILVKQGSNVIILDKKGLQEIEKVVGGKFKV